MKKQKVKLVLAAFDLLLFIFLLTAAKYCLADSGTVASYSFNELKTGADSFADQSGSGFDGKIFNAAVVGGISGTALYFNGKNSYASVLNNDKLNFGTGDFALSAWVKTVATTIGEAEGRGDIIDKGDPYNSGYALSSMDNRASALVGRSGRSGFGGYCGTVPSNPLDYNDFICPNDKFINDGAWHNLVAVREGGLIKIYLDTVLVHKYGIGNDANIPSSCPACQEAHKSGIVDNVDTQDDLIIGRHGEKEESFFRGKIDEVNVFNQALSQDQINLEYKKIRNNYSRAKETSLDNTLGFDYATEFNPTNDGNYTYTVKPGDTPWIIAEQCGHGEWWKGVLDPKVFHDANRNSIIWVGEKIKLSASVCSLSNNYSSEKQSFVSEESKRYTISKGDTLWSIAKKTCGNGSAWDKIFDRNSFTEVNGNIYIKDGDTITINPGLCR
jgi:LysM repeat protein